MKHNRYWKYGNMIDRAVILLDWRQYGVDGWIQFALAVDLLI